MPRRPAVLAGALLGAILCTPSAGRASSPPTGTLRDVTPALDYRGGPYFVSRPGGPLKTSVCSGADCDDFLLEVSLSADFVARHPADAITISVAWPNPSNDFDLYVLDRNGDELARSVGEQDPEVVRIPIPAGPERYTLRVVPFLVRGEGFEAHIEVESPPEAQPPPTPLRDTRALAGVE